MCSPGTPAYVPRVTSVTPNGVSASIGSPSENPGRAYVPEPVMIPTGIARDPTPNRDWRVLYDADCGFCRWSLAQLLALDRRQRLRPVALGTSEANGLLADLDPEARAASWHLVSPDGRRWSAGEAAPPLLRLLPGGTGRRRRSRVRRG